MIQDPAPEQDPFSPTAWSQAQRLIDYEKCKRVEAGGPFETVWPADFLLRESP